MANLPIKSFLGLRVSSDPEVGTALSVINAKRNVVRGRIENVDGCTTIPTVGTLPTDDGNKLIDQFVWKKPHSFYIADSGGKTIYAVVGTYRKRSHGEAAPVAVNTSGLFINPYYDGSWQDSWRELTEFYIFKYASAANNADPELVDITLTNTGGIAPSVVASIVNGGGFVAVKSGDFTNNDNTGFLVTGMAGNVLTLKGRTGDLTGWDTSTYIYVFRSIYNKLLPSSVTPQIRNVLDEIRVNTGSSTSDLDLAAFYRDKTFFAGNTIAKKGTFGEYGHLDVPSVTFKLRNLGVGNSLTDGFPSGAYTLKLSMLMDDGQETELRAAPTGQFAPTILLSKDVALGNNAVEPLDTDGTDIYAASFLASGTYNYIWKLDASGAILATAQITNATEGRVVGLACRNGYIYVMFASDSLLQTRLCVYNTSLNLVLAGAWTALNITPGYLYVTANDGYMYLWNSNGAQTQHQIIRYSLSTCNVDAASALENIAFTFNGHIACDNSYFIVMGTNHCYKWSATFAVGAHALSDVYTGMGSVETSAATIVGGNAYVGAGATLKKWVLSTDTITNHWTGGDAGGWYGLTNDGTYLYGANAQVIRKIDLTGTQIVSYTQTATESSYPLRKLGNSIYALTTLANLRIFSDTPAGATFTSDGFVYPTFDLAVSPGYVPRRGSKVRVYVSKDGGADYFTKEYSILSGGETFSATSVFDTDMKHRYYVSTGKSITGADLLAATVTSTLQIGRTSADAGKPPYSYAITANNRTYAVGVFLGGRTIRNKVYMSALSADGISMFDVLPNDVATILDVEFNDGDYALALGNVADRILVLKTRSLVLLTPNDDGTHNRDIVASGVGLAAPESLVAFNESLYWLDHTGVWQFNTSGLVNRSEAITQIILGFTDAQRAAAIGIIDPANLLYRLFINNVWYVLDLKDGEWTTEQWHASVYPVTAGIDIGSASRRYMWLTSTGFLWRPAAATRFNGNNYTVLFQTNKVELPLERGYDGLISALYCDYSSSVSVTLGLYLDDASSPMKTWTLPASAHGVVVPAPLAARCLCFRLEVSATTSADGQSISIRRLGAYFNQIPVGGDQHTT